MISIFPLWTFHLYVATFQQPLYMEYISLRWYDIPELVIPIRISLIEDCCQQGSYWTKGSYWLRWSHHFQSFTVATMSWLALTEYLFHKWPRICSTWRNHFTVLSSWLFTGFITRETRRVSLVEQHLRSLVLCVMFCGSLFSFCLFLILLFYCLSVDLRILRNTTGVISGTGTVYRCGGPEFIPVFWWVSCYSIFSFMCYVL